jgi:hypothetical protein
MFWSGMIVGIVVGVSVIMLVGIILEWWAERK